MYYPNGMMPDLFLQIGQSIWRKCLSLTPNHTVIYIVIAVYRFERSPVAWYGRSGGAPRRLRSKLDYSSCLPNEWPVSIRIRGFAEYGIYSRMESNGAKIPKTKFIAESRCLAPLLLHRTHRRSPATQAHRSQCDLARAHCS